MHGFTCLLNLQPVANDVVLHLFSFNKPYKETSSKYKQANKKTNFTVDLTRQGLLRLVSITIVIMYKTLQVFMLN